MSQFRPARGQQMDTLSEDNQTVATARKYLDDYPSLNEGYHHFTAQDQHLNPKILLKAALDYAPSFAGRVNVAKFIVNADENLPRKSCNERLEELARHVYTNLLVPCTHNPLPSLTVVQARGGSTGQVSERSSPPSGYELKPDEFETVNGRTGNRKKVLTLFGGPSDLKILRRCHYTCPMTNIKDNNYPGLTKGEPSISLECAHIIPHYLGEEMENAEDV
jgi:hypothetical protein